MLMSESIFCNSMVGFIFEWKQICAGFCIVCLHLFAVRDPIIQMVGFGIVDCHCSFHNAQIEQRLSINL